MIRAGLLLLLLLCAPTLWAQERILSYDSQVQVRADGSLEVTEEIRVRAEGNRIRRGIYRDFPTRYRDRYGNRVAVDFQMIEVLRDGQPEPWFIQRVANGVRINTGNDDFLPTPGEFSFRLRYRTTRQLGFFADHDELYWNAIGTGWIFPIESGSVEVRLPEPVPESQLRAEGYTGVQGSKDQHYEAHTPAPGTAGWRLSQPLQPHEGLTIVLSFPKGVVAAPSRAQKLLWLLRDNLGLLVSLAGLAVLATYCYWRWNRIGRDPPAGTVIVRYDPPAGHSPAGLRYMTRMGYDMRCFSADLLSLAVSGALSIQRDKKLLSDTWTLQRSPGDGSATTHTPEQAALLRELFDKKRTMLEFDKENATTIQGIIHKHTTALQDRFKPRMFRLNGGSIAIALLMAALFSFASFAVSATTGSLSPLLIPVVLAMFAVAITFAFLVKAPTVEGRKLLDEIEGFKRYLGVAEKQDLQRLQGPGGAEPQLDARRFEMLLPYAVALEVEDAWTKKFTLAVGAAAAAAATSAITWYHGAHIGDIASFSNAIGTSLASQIAASSSPPGSSSGGGGGGFSGGGGGGGGGGGR